MNLIRMFAASILCAVALGGCSLLAVRRLPRPALQVNTGQRQVNVAS
jgi:hypothetical protein